MRVGRGKKRSDVNLRVLQCLETWKRKKTDQRRLRKSSKCLWKKARSMWYPRRPGMTVFQIRGIVESRGQVKQKVRAREFGAFSP